MDFYPRVNETLTFMSRNPDTCVMLAQIAGATFLEAAGLRERDHCRACIQRQGNGGTKLWLDAEWFGSASMIERVYVFCHEALHPMLQHDEAARAVSKPSLERLRTAADLSVESLLRTTVVGKNIPDGLCRPENYGLPVGLTVMQYYRRLEGKIKDDEPEPEPEPDPDGDEGDEESEDGTPSHAPGQPDTGDLPPGMDFLPSECDGDGEPSTVDSLMPSLLSNLAESGGLGSSPFTSQLANIAQAKQRNWHNDVKRFLTHQMVRVHQSFSRPNRRHLWRDVILPSAKTGEAVGNLLIFQDCSGSMPDEGVKKCYSLLNDIIAQQVVDDSVEVSIMQFARGPLSEVEVFRKRDFPLKGIERKGSGGTQLAPCFEWLSRSRKRYVGVIVLTDGGISDKYALKKPKFPVLWVIDGHPSWTAEFGKVVHIT